MRQDDLLRSRTSVIPWEAHGTLQFSPNGGIDTLNLDWLIESSLFHSLLARNLLYPAINKVDSRDEKRTTYIFRAEANTIMASSFYRQIECGFSGGTGIVGDGKFVYSQGKLEAYKATALNMHHFLIAVEKPTGKGCRTDRNNGIFKLLHG